jgi:hypothetical protein
MSRVLSGAFAAKQAYLVMHGAKATGLGRCETAFGLIVGVA